MIKKSILLIPFLIFSLLINGCEPKEKITPEQWWTMLKSKDKKEIKKLLGGPPDYTGSDHWIYYKTCWSEDLEDFDTLWIYFNGDRIICCDNSPCG